MKTQLSSSDTSQQHFSAGKRVQHPNLQKKTRNTNAAATRRINMKSCSDVDVLNTIFLLELVLGDEFNGLVQLSSSLCSNLHLSRV